MKRILNSTKFVGKIIGLLSCAAIVSTIVSTTANAGPILPPPRRATPRPTPTPAPTPPPAANPPVASTPPATVHVNPDTLRTILLESDISVIDSLNDVELGKAQLKSAELGMFPSINVGAAISGGPTFALSEIAFLVPFLLPSNWFQLAATKHQFAADGYAFYIVELNEFASAMGIYTTMLGDIDLRAAYQKQVENLQQIYDFTEGRYEVGSEIKQDVVDADDKLKQAQIQLSKIDAGLAQEKAHLRQMLGFVNLDQDLVLDPYHLPARPEEAWTPETVLQQTYPKSPELSQVQSLVLAAHDAKWTSIFSFLTGSSISVATGNDPTAGAFGTLKGNTTAGLGPAYGEQISISNLDIAKLLIRETEVELEEGSVIDSTVKSIQQDLIQVSEAAQSVADADAVYQAALTQFQNGSSDLLHLFDASNSEVIALVQQAQVQIDLDGQRINLNRVLISDEFAKIHPCAFTKADQSSAIVGWISDIFGGDTTTVDKICRPDPNAERVAKTGK